MYLYILECHSISLTRIHSRQEIILLESASVDYEDNPCCETRGKKCLYITEVQMHMRNTNNSLSCTHTHTTNKTVMTLIS